MNEIIEIITQNKGAFFSMLLWSVISILSVKGYTLHTLSFLFVLSVMTLFLMMCGIVQPGFLGEWLNNKDQLF